MDLYSHGGGPSPSRGRHTGQGLLGVGCMFISVSVLFVDNKRTPFEVLTAVDKDLIKSVVAQNFNMQLLI